MQYVNHKGEPINLSAVQATAPARPKKESPTSFHKGWVVKGFPPEAVEEERARRGAEFDLDLYLRNGTPKKVRSKPYEVPAAANQCAELARRQGWLGVRVEEVSKGSVA